jgi:hypothetical protein
MWREAVMDETEKRSNTTAIWLMKRGGYKDFQTSPLHKVISPENED